MSDPDFPLLQRISEESVRALSPHDVRDHLRLLWWLFVEPEYLREYFLRVGDRALKQSGTWLISTLLWLPPLIITLGIALGTIPAHYRPFLRFMIGLMLIGLIVLGWLATGLMGREGILKGQIEVELSASMAESITPKVMRRVAFDMVSMALLFSACGFTFHTLIAGLVLVVALMVPFGITSGVANRVAGYRIERAITMINFAMATVVAISIAIIVLDSALTYPVEGMLPSVLTLAAAPLAGIIAFVVSAMATASLGVVTDVIVERTFGKDEVQTALRVGLVVALALAHLALLAICLFGGWRMLS